MGGLTHAVSIDDQEVEPMSRKRLAIVSSAAFLGIGLAIAPVAMAAADTPPPASTTMTTEAAAPVVTSAGGTFTVTLPGVGSLSFSVDPTTDVLTGLTVAPVDGSGFTAGTPVLSEEGVSIAFTSGAGTTVLQVEIHPSATGPVVTAEVNAAEDQGEGPGQGDQPGGMPRGDDHQDSDGQGDNHQGADGHGDDQQGATPPTTMPAPPVAVTPAPSNSGHDGSDGEGDGSPATAPGSDDQGTGRSDGGSGDGPSGQSDGGHGDQSSGGSSGSGHGG
jgi:uncharacterized membrane protein YgcG